MPVYHLIGKHVFVAERLHGDDTTIPIQAKGNARPAVRESGCAGGDLLCVASGIVVLPDKSATV